MFDCDGPQTAEEHAAERAAYAKSREKQRGERYKEILTGLIYTFRSKGEITASDINYAERTMKGIS